MKNELLQEAKRRDDYIHRSPGLIEYLAIVIACVLFFVCRG
jgi:hypothetical protein